MTDASAWMPLYIGDYLADTMHLTAEEHGAYLLLIMHYWRRGPLPDNDKALAMIAHIERGPWTAEIGPTIRAFLAETPQGLIPLSAERWRYQTFGRLPQSAWRALRRAVIERDGPICSYCGDRPDEPNIDHVHPLALGGTNDLSNLVVACRFCNSSKGATPLDAWIRPL